MPLISRTFDQLIDFTRTTAATYVNSAGLVTLTPPSVNLLTFTQEFDNAVWTKGAVTVFPNQNPATTTGPELRATGAIAMLGTSTAATYNTSTGVGTATRTDPSNLSGVTFTIPNASGLYAVSINNTGATTMQIRINALNGTVVATLAPGVGGIFPVSGMAAGTPLITLTASTDGTTASFTVNSVRQLVEGFIAAPDGTFTADAIIEDTVNGVHRVNATYTFAATTPHTFSAYVKANGRNFCRLSNGSDNIGVFVNLTTGAVVSVTSGAFATVSDAGNGWWRIAVTFTPLTAAAKSIAINASVDGVNLTYTGNGVSGLFVWGAQLEAVPAANLVLGPELVTLLDGWTASNATTSVVGGQLVITSSGSGTAYITKNFTNVGNAYYYSTSTVSGGSVAVNTYRSGPFTNFMFSLPTDGTNLTQVSTDTDATAAVTLFWTASAAGETRTLSNISIKEFTGVTNMPSAYAKNVGGLFPARFDYDPVTLAPRGILIEEQRTNLLLRSEEFDNATWGKSNFGGAGVPVVTANSGVSPDGNATADRAQFTLNGGTTTSDRALLQQSVTIVTSTAYTFSVWIRSLSGTVSMGIGCDNVVGNTPITVTTAWQRFTASGTAAGTSGLAWLQLRGGQTPTQSNTADVLVWGAQLEAGAFATSYIPTTASTVTRAPDIANVTVANFSSWYNQPSGTFVTAFDVLSTATNAKSAITTNDGTSNNINIIYVSTAATANMETRSGGSSQAALVPGSVTVNTAVAGAFAYRANDFAAAIGGGAVSTDTSGAVAVGQTTLNIGYSSNYGGLYLNGHIRSIRYYPARLNNAQLQTLTA
jgi:hypothetical protein